MSSRHRLGGRRRIARIREHGVVVREDGVRARVQAGASDVSRVAVGVTRAASAVERNRARRRTRAALATVLPEVSLDAVLSVPREAATMPFEDLRTVLSACMLRAARAVAAS
ncbi:MAG: ribonuclease P protein component [Candidatus Dormibacteraeota bacterium]|nr:ribonuclease P protein component [Candidatus Dormibacteraeota bacterium]